MIQCIDTGDKLNTSLNMPHRILLKLIMRSLGYCVRLAHATS